MTSAPPARIVTDEAGSRGGERLPAALFPPRGRHKPPAGGPKAIEAPASSRYNRPTRNTLFDGYRYE